MSMPIGGSLSALLATADQFVDTWVTHAKDSGASTPELMVSLLLATEKIGDEKSAITAAMLATAIQRLVPSPLRNDADGDTCPDCTCIGFHTRDCPNWLP